MIDLNLSDDQRLTIEALRALLAEYFPVPFPRGNTDERLARGYRALVDFGAFSIALPENQGGAGLTIAEEMLLHVEFGRHLVSPSVIGVSLSMRLAATRGDAVLAATIASGRTRVGFGTGVQAAAGHGAESMKVSLHDAVDSDLVLIWHAGGFDLVETKELALSELVATDRSVRLSQAILNGRSVMAGANGQSPLLIAIGHLLVSAQLLGMAEASRDMAVAYAGVREQFGQPIGSFQAIKHHCANMAINTAVLRAQLLMATLAVRGGRPDAEFNAEACRMLAGRYALANARSNIQVHGGMGFSAECSAHLYLLRAHLLENFGIMRGDLAAAFAARPPLAFAGKPLAKEQEIVSCGSH